MEREFNPSLSTNTINFLGGGGRFLRRNTQAALTIRHSTSLYLKQNGGRPTRPAGSSAISQSVRSERNHDVDEEFQRYMAVSLP